MLSLEVVKCLASREQIEELRTNAHADMSQRVLVSTRYAGIYMSQSLLENITHMINFNKSKTMIMRRMFRSVIEQDHVWATSTAREMRMYDEIAACRGLFIISNKNEIIRKKT